MTLAYAKNRSTVGKRDSSPNALLLVICAHIALVAVVMSARMDLPSRIKSEGPIIVESWRNSPAPQPHIAPQPTKQQAHATPQIDNPIQAVRTVPLAQPPVDSHPGMDALLGGNGVSVTPIIPQPTTITPIRHDHGCSRRCRS